MRIRWMIKRDVAEVLEIERLAFGLEAWDGRDLRDALARRSGIGMVVESGGCVLGYMVYDTFKDKIVLSRLAVHPDNAHQRVATAMVESLKGKSGPKRDRIETIVRDDNLVAHMFLRKCGFVCVSIIKELFDQQDDGYLFIFDGHPARRTDAAFAKYGE